MKFVIMFFFAATTALAQPMNGRYTVGGAFPDFDSLQHAVTALRSRGVDGPVFIDIRPGVYMPEGGAAPLINLDTVITGASAENRVTFQADGVSGGNADNVILQIAADANAHGAYLDQVVLLGADYVGFRNLTFRDADSMNLPSTAMINVRGVFSNTTVEGLVIDGCKFFGSPYYTSGVQFGTDFALYANAWLMSASLTNNTFDSFVRALFIGDDGAGDTIIIADNHFTNGFNRYSGAGSALGRAIFLECRHAFVERNIIRNFYSAAAIQVFNFTSARIDQNEVQGFFTNDMIGLFGDGGTTPVDTKVFNNALVGRATASISVYARKAEIYHNTVLGGGSGGSIGAVFQGDSVTVMNNIFIVENGIMGMDFGYTNQAPGLVSDHNLYFVTGATYFAHHDGLYYTTFESFASATGLDAHSKFKHVAIDFDSIGLHIDLCNAQDPALNGIPIPEVPFDYYGTVRDSVIPFIGAVEGKRIPYDMFAQPYREGLNGPAYSVTAALLDDPSHKAIAVPDFDNMQVRVFHNNGALRTFSNTKIMSVGFNPTGIRFFDLDHDGNQDLVVSGEASSIRVFWGDGTGNFPDDTTIATEGRLRTIDTGNVSFWNYKTIIGTEDNGFLPNTSFAGYIDNSNGRHISWNQVRTPVGNLGGNMPDTVNDVMGDVITLDLDGNGSQEFVALSIGFPTYVYVFSDTVAGNHPWGHRDKYLLGTGTYLGLTSSIIKGDFDNDGHVDIIATGADDNNLIFLHGNGDRTFTQEIIADHASRGLTALDYEHDGDLDFVTCDRTLDSLGVSVFLNDGLGHFTVKENCRMPFASGNPISIIAEDFDLDGKTDIAVTTFDSLFVLYNLGGNNGVTGVQEIAAKTLPADFMLFQNYPNPFNPQTTIRFALPHEALVHLRIYNVLGQEVATLASGTYRAGTYNVQWNADRMPSGVYFYSISSEQFTQTRKLIILK